MAPQPQNPGNPTPPAVTLRPPTADDDAFLFTLYASTREGEFDAPAWSEEQRNALLQMQFIAQQAGYRGEYPEANTSVICEEPAGRPIGRMIVERSGEAILLVDMALLPAFRSRGVGTTLIRALQDEAAAKQLPLRLHVAKGGRSRRLAERMGFRISDDLGSHWALEWHPDPPPRPK